MNLNSKLAREILKNAEEHRLAQPVYIGINKNPTKNTYGEFHIYPDKSVCRSVAHLLVSKTKPRHWHGTDPISGCRSFNAPAVLAVDTKRESLDQLIKKMLAANPMAPFVAGHLSSDNIRTWGLFFRSQDERDRFCQLAISIERIDSDECVWLCADEKDRIK